MNLYLVVLGGKIRGANIEMHDVRLVIGKTIESTLPQLKSEWIGQAKGLHIDSYKSIHFVDGYKIKILDKAIRKEDEVNRLWLINLGGYKEGEMLEQHRLELVVAKSAKTAKSKALKKWKSRVNQIHKDNLLSIDTLQKFTIALEPAPYDSNDGMKPDWSGYWVIS